MGRAGANLPPRPPKVQKLSENDAPEGTPGTPQGTLKSSKSGKKSHPKIIIFPNPLWEGFRKIFELKNGAKMSRKWGLRRQRERKQQKLQKPQICNTFHKKTPIFQGLKTYKIDKNLRKCMQRTKLALRWPSRSDFSWFCLHFGAPRGAWNDPKKSQKRSLKKGLTKHPIAPPSPNGDRAQVKLKIYQIVYPSD